MTTEKLTTALELNKDIQQLQKYATALSLSTVKQVDIILDSYYERMHIDTQYVIDEVVTLMKKLVSERLELLQSQFENL